MMLSSSLRDRGIDATHRFAGSPRLPVWAGRGAGGLAAVLAARAVALALGGAPVPIADAPAAAFVPASPVRIAQAHLFGMPAAGAVDTSLALVLGGVLAGDFAGEDTAIIGAPGQAQAVYRTGDAFPGGGVLDSVGADYVLIRNQGRRERLSLAVAGAGGAPTAAAVAPGVTDANAGVPASGVDIVPVVEAGHVVGVRISTPDVASLERVGLRRDDIVVAVDGAPVDGAGLERALASVRAGGGADLTVRREGREQAVHLGR